MKKIKTAVWIIFIVLLLLVTFLWGGNAPGLRGEPTDTKEVCDMESEEVTDLTTPEGKASCIISVRCDTVFLNRDFIEPSILESLPENGVILSPVKVDMKENDSVFDILERTLRGKNIHMEFTNTPMYKSAYIEGISNLYEFDCGELSGWMYKVNGDFPDYGSSLYEVKSGDVIEWVYTCDRGKDVGENIK